MFSIFEWSDSTARRGELEGLGIEELKGTWWVSDHDDKGNLEGRYAC
jgi:hypothetical protein